jgi:hypothetical protein
MSDCPHRRSAVMMHPHQDTAPCPDCTREDLAEAENDMGGNFSRDVFTISGMVYGALALVAIAAATLIAWLGSAP